MTPAISRSEAPVCQRAAGIEPPLCCQPDPLTIARWDERLDAITAHLDAVRPRRCPSCGADAVPLFWVDVDVYECGDPDCRAIFSGRGD